ncbi:MAG: GNAT family N-acetyltransferase [Acidobacteria bacterium]|nr:GNAT family N-acetyltransferase [Acidobacteriota bacterium]
MPTSADFHIRLASPADALTVADIHTRSWQTAYRGIMSDAYLDQVAAEERRAAWTQKLSASAPENRAVLLAERSGGPVGFVCVVADHDRQWGSFIDNLHVVPEWRGTGGGRRLMQAAAAWLIARQSANPVYLWVFEPNTEARAFYRRMGGREAETGLRDTPEGLKVPGFRCVWDSPQVLTEPLAR